MNPMPSLQKPSSDNKGTPRTGWLIKVTAFLVMVVLSLGILEAISYWYLRIFDGYDGKHLMNYEFDDYKNIRPMPNYVNTKGISHNSQGFRRSEDVTPDKPIGTYRIFLMGGSTAYGIGSLAAYGNEKYPLLKNNETIDYYLEQFFKNRVTDRHIEVINAAITSHQSHHHLIYLNQTILKYHPDMIVFLDGFNDYYPYEKDFDQFKNYAYQERAHYFMGEPTLGAWTGYSGWWLFRKSHFIYLTAKTVRPLWLMLSNLGVRRVRIDIEEALKNLRINAERNFLKMVKRNAMILREEGIIPVFTLQPEIFFQQDKRFTVFEDKVFEWLSQEWQINLVEFKRAAKPIVVEGLERVTKESNALFIDLTNPFVGMDEEDVYTDYCHLTPAGNKRIAEVIGGRILSIVAGS